MTITIGDLLAALNQYGLHGMVPAILVVGLAFAALLKLVQLGTAAAPLLQSISSRRRKAAQRAGVLLNDDSSGLDANTKALLQESITSLAVEDSTGLRIGIQARATLRDFISSPAGNRYPMPVLATMKSDLEIDGDGVRLSVPIMTLIVGPIYLLLMVALLIAGLELARLSIVHVVDGRSELAAALVIPQLCWSIGFVVLLKTGRPLVLALGFLRVFGWAGWVRKTEGIAVDEQTSGSASR